MKHFAHIFKLLGALLFIALPTSCQLDRSFFRHANRGELEIARFDCAVEEYLSTGSVVSWQKLNADYPRETKALVENVLHIGKIDSEGIEDTLRIFYADTTLLKLRHDVSTKFSDMSDCEKSLQIAFKQLSKECDDFVTPRVYTQNSAFNQSIVVGDSLLGISLDKYLGANYRPYKKYFSENQRATLESSRIVQDCLSFYLAQLYIIPNVRGRVRPSLLDWMMHQGKIAWVVAQLTDSKLIDIAGCQSETKAWYASHEPAVWAALNHEELLGSRDSLLVSSVIMSGDAHPYFHDAHSRGVGLWIGMRIVDSYMKNHPEVDINTLLHTTDYPTMLKEANYQPATCGNDN